MRHLPRTFVRFATVGVANTLIDLVLFWVLVTPLGIVAANVVSTSAGMAFSFLANGRHTFGATRPTLRQALLFLGTNAVTMWLLQPLVIIAAQDVLGVPLMTAKILALGSSVAGNFLLYRYVVWPAKNNEAPSTGPGPMTGGACAPSSVADGANPVRRHAADEATTSDEGLRSGARRTSATGVSTGSTDGSAPAPIPWRRPAGRGAARGAARR